MKRQEKRKWLFYQFPHWLFESPYNQLSDKAKLIFPLLWDRTSFSEANGWFDSEDNIYVYYTNEQLAKKIGCSNKPIVKAKKELADAGLIKEVRQGVNKPNVIYVFEPKIGSVESTHQEVSNVHNGSVESTHQEVSNVHAINTNIINNNISRLSNQDDGAEDIDSVNKDEFLEPIDQQQQHSIFDEIQENFGRGLKPIEYETVKYMLEENPKELVSLALKRAVLNGKPSVNYMDGILRSWRQKNITTVLEAEQELDKSKSKQPVKTPSSVPEWSNPNYKEPVNKMSEEEIAKILAEEERLKKLGHKFI